MALVDIPLSSALTNHSTSSKWLFNSSRDLVEIPPETIPIDHDPTTGASRGLLIEPEATNLYPFARTMEGMDMTSGISRVPSSSTYSILFMDNVLRFDPTVKEKTATYVLPELLGEWYLGISFFVKRMDGQKPVYGRSYFRDANFTILINGRESIDASSQIEMKETYDGSWWFRARMRTPQVPVISVSISTGYFNDHKELVVGGLQIETQRYTSFIPTNGEPETREENWAEVGLTPNETINSNQGTYDLSFTHLPGSEGAAFNIVGAGDTSYIIGNRSVDPEDRDYIIIQSPDLPNDGYALSFEPLGEYYRKNRVQLTYSAYGTRISINNTPVNRSQYFGFNFDENNAPKNIILGKRANGDVMNGYINSIRLHARAFRDDEMVNE